MITDPLVLSDFLINSHVTQLVTEPTRFRLYQQPSILDFWGFGIPSATRKV